MFNIAYVVVFNLSTKKYFHGRIATLQGRDIEVFTEVRFTILVVWIVALYYAASWP